MDMGIQCPHCLLDMRMSIQLNEEVNECPSCEGLWLDSLNLEKMFGFGKFNTRVFNDQFQNNIRENSPKAYGQYYYYKKPFRMNVNKDDTFGFE